MTDQQTPSPTPDEEQEEVIDMEKEWGPYLSEEERDAVDAATWDLSKVKVWPAGLDGPAIPLTELAAWRADRERMRRELEQLQDDERENGEEV